MSIISQLNWKISLWHQFKMDIGTVISLEGRKAGARKIIIEI